MLISDRITTIQRINNYVDFGHTLLSDIFSDKELLLQVLEECACEILASQFLSEQSQ